MERKIVQRKVTVLIILISLFFIILGGRLAYLQIAEADRYQGLARDNMIRIIPITAPRGEILDRNEELLVDNKPIYTLSLSFLGVSENEQQRVKEILTQILSVDDNLKGNKSEWDAKIEEAINAHSLNFEPAKIATNLAWDTVVQIRERQLELPGVIIEEEPVRDYPHGGMLAHVLGYVREINEPQLERNRDNGYRMGDNFGQAGLEYSFEEELRGEKGARRIEVDANGHLVDVRGRKTPVPGNNLVLTINTKLQQAVEEALEKGVERAQENDYEEAESGAAVVLDVNTGQVLAMATYPTFSPEIFNGNITSEEYNELPLLNRALQAYPPGSIFKMVTGSAILENNIVDPEHAIDDKGYYNLGDTRFNDWEPGGHGNVDFKDAIKFSCNTYFYKYGREVGHSEITKYAKEFGFGEETGIKLPEDRAGVVPSPEYKREMTRAFLSQINPSIQEIKKEYDELINQAETEEQIKGLKEERDNKINTILSAPEYRWDLEWHTYDTLNMAIGQGYNLNTPLQLVNYVAAIANGGTLYTPYVVQKITTPGDDTEKNFNSQVVREIDVSSGNLDLIREGMHEVTQQGGTAAGVFRDFPLSAAAKTGTAEVGGHDNHALFASFVPYENPEIAVVSIIEYGSTGGGIAGPVVRDILDAYVEITRGDLETDENN